MRMHPGIPLAIGATTLFALAAVWVVARPAPLPVVPVATVEPAQNRAGSAQPTASPAELDALRAEIEMLRVGLIDLDGRVATAPLDTVRRGDSPGEGPPTPLVAEPPPARRHIDPIRAQVAASEDRLLAEVDDPAFADDVSAELREALVETTGGVERTDTRCGESLCRIEVSFEDTMARDAHMTRLPHAISWSPEGFVATDENDPTRVLVYAARAGASLPGTE